MKYWLWFFQALYLIMLSVPIYFAWTNQMTFREGLEHSGKWAVTIAMLIVFLCVEIVTWKIYRSIKKEE